MPKQKKTFIEVCRKIVEEKQNAKFDKISIDLYSASAVLTIYDKLNEENKVKLLACHPVKMVDICFRMINKQI